MKKLAVLLALGASVVSFAVAQGQAGNHSFALDAPNISGFPSGEILLTGGGTFDAASGFLKGGGGFRCNRDINQGPLTGCRADEGVRWDASEIVPSAGFKCTGSLTEPLKTALTDDRTIVMRADFYRAGDGIHESFRALMIVSSTDLDPDRPGIQNVWVQGVGCGEAQVNFR